jgi:hypothetical protein
MKTNQHFEMALARDVAPIAPGDQAYLRLWYSLAKRPWRSLVIVPGHEGGSADEAARTLAEVGQKVSGLPVQSITMRALDYGTAQALADLQEQLRRIATEGSEPPQAIEVYPVAHHEGPAGQGEHERREGEGPNWAWARHPESHQDPKPGAPPSPAGAAHSGDLKMTPLPASRFVISVPFLLTEPLGLSATQGADVVLVLVKLGHTRMKDLRAIIDQVGRERMTGCVLVK